MRINKLMPFYTEEDKQIYLKYRQEYENWEQRTAEVTREMHAAIDAGDNDRYKELLDLTHVIAKAFNEGAATEWIASHNNAVLRYINSFAGDKASILADVQEIVDAATRKDFLEYLDTLKEAGRPILESDPGPDSPYDKEEYNHWKKITTRNWENCVYYLRTQTRLQFQTLKFNDFDTAEAVAILEAKASDFYQKPGEVSTEVAAAAKKYPDYIRFRQNASTNMLYKTIITPYSKNVEYDKYLDTDSGEVYNRARIKNGDFELIVLSHNIPKLGTSANQLLDEISTVFTRNGGRKLEVSFSIEEHMELKDLKDRKYARKQVLKDLETLFNTSFNHTYTYSNGREADFRDVRLIQEKGIENGVINVVLGTRFANYLSKSETMWCPKLSQKVSERKHANSYAFIKTISGHKHMNLGKSNEDIVAVETLVKAANMTPYENIKESGRQVYDRLIGPFEDDMDACASAFGWHYCRRNGERISDEEAAHLDYKTFISLMVHIVWKNYPESARRIEGPKSKTKKPRRIKSAAT